MQISSALAQLPAAAPHAAAPAIGTGSLAGALGSLVAVVALILALGWLARRLQSLRGARRGTVQVVGGASIGSKERVVVVQIGDDRLVLGVAPGSVNLLHRYGAAAAGAAPDTATAAAPGAVVIPFADRLRDMLRKQDPA